MSNDMHFWSIHWVFLVIFYPVYGGMHEVNTPNNYYMHEVSTPDAAFFFLGTHGRYTVRPGVLPLAVFSSNFCLLLLRSR